MSDTPLYDQLLAEYAADAKAAERPDSEPTTDDEQAGDGPANSGGGDT